MVSNASLLSAYNYQASTGTHANMLVTILPVERARAGVKIKLDNMGLTYEYWSLSHLSHRMSQPTNCICENKGADQLRGYPQS